MHAARSLNAMGVAAGTDTSSVLQDYLRHYERILIALAPGDLEPRVRLAVLLGRAGENHQAAEEERQILDAAEG